MEKEVKIDDLIILNRANKLVFFQDTYSKEIKCSIECSRNEARENLKKFKDFSKNFKNDTDTYFEIVLEKFLRNLIITNISYHNDRSIFDNIIVNCSNNKTIELKYINEYQMKDIFQKVKRHINYYFYKYYLKNKKEIDNIILLDSELNSYVSLIKNDHEIVTGNSLYISVAKENESIIFNNDFISNLILSDFYETNNLLNEGIDINDENNNVILKFSNNKKILFSGCREKYHDFIENFKNELIDIKIGKVYKKR